MSAETVLVVNPRSAGGRTGTRWRDMYAVIERALPSTEVCMTEGPGHATELAREALARGARQIVAVGGDGTNNEVVNAFFDDQGQPISTDAAFGFIPSGTGGDLGRSFGGPHSLRAAARRIADGSTRRVDVGMARFVDHQGAAGCRAFLNIASFGLSAAVVRSVNASGGGGRLAYTLATGRAIFAYRNGSVEVIIDDAEAEACELTLCAIANGKYFGGGMKVAPNAEIDDGGFDVIQVWGWKPLGFLVNAPRVFSGTHLGLPGVSERRQVRRVEARVTGSQEVLVELDGEQPGVLPATFELRAACLDVIG